MTGSAPSQGLATLRRRLADLPVRARAEAGVALEAIGQDVLAETRATLAAGADDPDGTLAGSLTATIESDASRLTIASASPAAMPLEFGTRGRPAHPFLRPAVDAAQEAALGHLRAALGRALGSGRRAP